MCSIVSWLAAALRPFMDCWQPVLFVDCCTAHLNPNVFELRRDLGIWIMVIPACLTYMMQPLDTIIFCSFKSKLADFYRAAKMSNDGGFVGIIDLISAIIGSSDFALQGRRWAHSCSRMGFGSSQANVNKLMMHELQLTSKPIVSSCRPSVDLLRVILPRSRRVVEDFCSALSTTAPIDGKWWRRSQRRCRHQGHSVWPDDNRNR
jgi:hypothetical protein